MKILLDESVPWPLNDLLPGQNCVSVQQRGWAGLKNGELLKRAVAEFGLFITSDQGIRYQQNLAEVHIAILQLSTNDIRRIRAAADNNTRSNRRHWAARIAGTRDTVTSVSVETRSLPALSRHYPRGFTFYVAHPFRSIETRSLPTLPRSFPRSFTFYVAHPIRSIVFGRFPLPHRYLAASPDMSLIPFAPFSFSAFQLFPKRLRFPVIRFATRHDWCVTR